MSPLAENYGNVCRALRHTDHHRPVDGRYLTRAFPRTTDLQNCLPCGFCWVRISKKRRPLAWLAKFGQDSTSTLDQWHILPTGVGVIGWDAFKLQMQMVRSISDTSSYFTSSRTTSGSLSMQLLFRVRLAWSCHERSAHFSCEYQNSSQHIHGMLVAGILHWSHAELRSKTWRRDWPAVILPEGPKDAVWSMSSRRLDIMSSDSQAQWAMLRQVFHVFVFVWQVMDNVTNPKKETLIRTTALRMCSRYIQYNAHTCAQYTLCFILYGSPPLAFKMQMSF